MGRPLRTLAATSAAVAALAMSSSSAAAGTLDQQQTDRTGTLYAVHSTQSLAQTFTAGMGGGLDQVDLHLRIEGTPTAPLTVEIRNVSAGAPGGTVLASASLPASSFSLTSAFVPISFTPPAAVVAGTPYAIVAYSSTVLPTNFYVWSSAGATHPYAGGGGFSIGSSPPSGIWSSPPTLDFTFKTYVQPPTTPSTTGQRAAALKKCKKKNKSARARKKCRKKAQLLPV